MTKAELITHIQIRLARINELVIEGYYGHKNISAWIVELIEELGRETDEMEKRDKIFWPKNEDLKNE